MKCESCAILKRELKKSKEEAQSLHSSIAELEKRHNLLKNDFITLKEVSENQDIPIMPGQKPREGKKFVTMDSGLTEVDLQDKKYQ